MIPWEGPVWSEPIKVRHLKRSATDDDGDEQKLEHRKVTKVDVPEKEPPTPPKDVKSSC